MSLGLTHDRIQRQLRERLKRYAQFAYDSGLEHYPFVYESRQAVKEAVTTEKTHDVTVPSGKDYCRTDVELDLPRETLAFEIKTSTSDAKNWFTQRKDYRSLGLKPALVIPQRTAYKLTPHLSDTLRDSYIIINEQSRDYYWNHASTPEGIDTQFTVGDPMECYDKCPDCGCWTKSTGYTVSCTNCRWSEFVQDNDR